MRNKLKLEKLLNKYIIVVDKDEKKVVYDIDDSRIFSVHITGCGRGARNTVLTNRTFKSLKDTERGIKYLDTCYWTCKFKAVLFSEYKSISETGYNYLIYDINDYNRDIDLEKEIKKERDKKEKAEYLELKNKAINLLNSYHILSIDNNDEIITLSQNTLKTKQ